MTEPDEHPMVEAVPVIIDAMGWERAMGWWMTHAMGWPTDEAMRYSTEAVEAMVRDDIDHVIVAEDGEELARAFQWVRLFALEPFVAARRATQTLGGGA